MIVLAAIPSTSVFAVVSRTVASGFFHGFIIVIGIVIGDITFIIIAVYGLSVIAESMGSMFVLVKYLGAAYLIWFGIELWRTKSEPVQVDGIEEPSWLSNFMCGLFITLGDQKAILFYMGFFPAFVDLSNVSISDISIIMVVAAVAVGGVKLGYAYLADKTKLLFKSSRAKKGMNIMAGSAMIGTGIILVAKA
jgi:threonine/homoserine/homoserine lactone efflux protein